MVCGRSFEKQMKYCIVEVGNEFADQGHPCYVYDTSSVMRILTKDIQMPRIFNNIEEAKFFTKNRTSHTYGGKWIVVDANEVLLFLAEMKLKQK